MPDLRQLRVFVAVAEQLSFTRAAEVLHLTQQTVSKTIRELERELGVELLERTTREVRITEAGATLLESGAEVLRVADAAFARTRQVGSGLSGTVRVGLTPAIGPLDQVDVVRALRTAGSDVSVSFLDLRPGDLHRSLRAREVDLVLTRASGAQDATLHRADLRPTPMVVCVPRDHRLAGADTVELAQLDGERLLAASRVGTPYTDLLLSRFAAAGATLTVVEARVTGATAMLTDLVESDAVALMPIGTTPPEGVVVLAVADVSVPLVLLWPAGTPAPAVRRLREALGVERPVR
jgi:DNA-binding transcriptional LysR family regulator